MRLVRFFVYVVLIGLSINGFAEQTQNIQSDNPIYKPIPINMAEAIIEPFWDPGLSGLDQWIIGPGHDWGLEVKQNWAAVDFEWASRPEKNPALRMCRDFNVDCSDYDLLLVRMAGPEKSVLKITATTDLGELVYTSEPAFGNATEHKLDLHGAKLIKKLGLEIITEAEGPGAGWFY